MPRVLAPARPLPAATLLQLIWLASPALPVGGFSYSEGLESAVDASLVTDEAQAGDWLLDQLRLTQARSDLACAARAFRAWSRGDLGAAARLNDWIAHTRETQELRQQTQQMGRSIAGWLLQRHPQDEHVQALRELQPAPCWPIAFALAAQRTGAPLRDSLLALAFGWAENMVQAALKAMPLGQNAGQRILARLADAIPQAVDLAIAEPDSARQSFAPMHAILCARHETQYSRLFRS